MFKDTIKILRDQKGLNQSELASILNVSRTTISHWETGTSEPPFELLINIADYFEVSTDFLLGRLSKNKNDTSLNEYLKDCLKMYYQHIKNKT